MCQLGCDKWKREVIGFPPAFCYGVLAVCVRVSGDVASTQKVSSALILLCILQLGDGFISYGLFSCILLWYKYAKRKREGEADGAMSP